MNLNQAHIGNALELADQLQPNSIHAICCNPPYWGLRDYGLPPFDWPAVDYAPLAGLPPVRIDAWRGCLGLEPDPFAFIGHIVAIFRALRRGLRDDGVLWLNFGDSYFSNGQREVPYGTFDKGPEDYQGRGCLCENLCGVCREVYRRKSRTCDLLVPTLIASLSDSTRESMGFEIDHLPTSDLVYQASHTLDAIRDFGYSFLHDVERLRAFQESTPDEFSRQLLVECLRRVDSLVCLSCARSLTFDAQECARTIPDFAAPSSYNQDIALPCDQQAHHSQYKDRACEYCTNVSSYSPNDIQPHCTTEQGFLQNSGLKPKDLCGIPWRVALALQADGWWLRSDVIWHKVNPMPESVTDRPTKAHEYLFLLSKSERYYYDAEAVREASVDPEGSSKRYDYEFSGRDGLIMPDGNIQRIAPKGKREFNGSRNRRTVWTVATKPYSAAHFATYPPALIEPCILASTSERGCCPNCGAGWVRVVEQQQSGFDGSKYGESAIKANGGIKSGGTAKSTLGSSNGKLVNQYQTTGFRPGCDCPPHEPVPSVVLDPFLGSGTTAEVAIKHRRAWVGFEASAEYAQLINDRLNGVQVRLMF